jgi:hypothetical protein
MSTTSMFQLVLAACKLRHQQNHRSITCQTLFAPQTGWIMTQAQNTAFKYPKERKSIS